MRCHNTSVPITPTSASQVAALARSRRRHAAARSVTRVAIEHRQRDDRRDHTADAQHHHGRFSARVGEVMNRVSTSTRALSPGCAGTFSSVNTPAT